VPAADIVLDAPHVHSPLRLPLDLALHVCELCGETTLLL
jgi:hypothetical protein